MFWINSQVNKIKLSIKNWNCADFIKLFQPCILICSSDCRNTYVWGRLCIEVFFLNDAVLVWSSYCSTGYNFVTLYIAPANCLYLKLCNSWLFWSVWWHLIEMSCRGVVCCVYLCYIQYLMTQSMPTNVARSDQKLHLITSELKVFNIFINHNINVIFSFQPSGWRKLRNIVQWTPFFQTYKKQRYPWVQLAGHQGRYFVSVETRVKITPKSGTSMIRPFLRAVYSKLLFALVTKDMVFKTTCFYEHFWLSLLSANSKYAVGYALPSPVSLTDT